MKFNFYSADINQDFDPEKIFPKFETSDQARSARSRIVKALREHHSDKLANKLEGCSMRRCRSAACPICLRMFRAWWSSELASYIAQDTDDWHTVSIVPPDLTFPMGELSYFKWSRAKDRLRKQIERSPATLSYAMGGIDYAVQNFPGRSPKWRPHFYFLTQGGGEGRIKTAFSRHYKADNDTKVPVRITPLKVRKQDLIATATYTFKAVFSDRQLAIDTRGNADTKSSSLDSRQEAELAVFLHRQGFLGRLIRHGKNPYFPALSTR
jgi:hypothetical protein